MKEKKILDSLNLIDDKYIEEADPKRKAKRSNAKWLKIAAIAACFCIVLSSALWLFLPFNTDPPSMSEYKDSEYYGIIKKISAFTHRGSAYKNNFDMILSSFGDKSDNNMNFGASDALGEPMAPTDDAAPEMSQPSGDSYHETTDNQVEGVIEADLIKRSDKYIYYLRYHTLCVYSIEGKDSKLVGEYKFSKDAKTYYRNCEFYLSEDCNTVTVIAPNTNHGNARISIFSLDVSDPENIKQNGFFNLTGSYLSSRMTDGKLLLLSEYYVNSYDIDFSDQSTFLPQFDNGDGMQSIPAKDIFYPETLTSTRYTVVCKLDEKTLQTKGCAAFLSYSKDVYVSTDTVYVTRPYTNTVKDGELRTDTAMTEISGLSYGGDSLTYKGSISLAGNVKNQYSLDEYKGMLRVVTTTRVDQYKEKTNGNSTSVSIIQGNTSGTNASLYCVDLNTWEIAAKVVNFAPKGETVESVRFDKDYAYVCTAQVVTFTDPVFFFDLSDINNITYTDTGTIDGYSSSLVNLGDGYLLGIGVGSTWNTVKIEVYRETENKVEAVCSYEVNGYYSTDYKSYLIDRENNLIGLGICDSNMLQHDRYVLLCFDGYRLIELVNYHVPGENDQKRAVYIDRYLYMFSEYGFYVTEVN